MLAVGEKMCTSWVFLTLLTHACGSVFCTSSATLSFAHNTFERELAAAKSKSFPPFLSSPKLPHPSIQSV